MFLHMPLTQLHSWMLKLYQTVHIDTFVDLPDQTIAKLLGEEIFYNNLSQLQELQMIANFVTQHRVNNIPLPWNLMDYFNFRGHMLQEGGCL